MTEYAVLYDYLEGSYAVISREQFQETWYVKFKGLNEGQATELVEAFEAKEREGRR